MYTYIKIVPTSLISKYSKFRNFLNILIKIVKNVYHHSKIYNNKGNVKHFWETVNYKTNNLSINYKNTYKHLLINNDGTKIIDSKIFSNICNGFFSTVPTEK